MTTPTIYEFPTEWYSRIVTQKLNLRSINQSAALSWNGAGQAISGPHTQMWLCDLTFAPMVDPMLQDFDAFFARLRGRSGVMRLSNAYRLDCWYNRNLVSGVTGFTDGSHFTDGSGFISGLLPPEIYVTTAAAKGARYITLGGLPSSLASALRRGDLLQIKPSGVAGTVPHLYKAMYGGNTNSSGQIGLAIEPGLRAGVNAGDVVGLRTASTLFRTVDDTQFEIAETGADGTGVGGSLVEALDLVP